MTAFAFGRLARVNAFHRSPGNSVTLEHPLYDYQPGFATPKPVKLIPCSAVRDAASCFDHPSLIMVNGAQTGSPSKPGNLLLRRVAFGTFDRRQTPVRSPCSLLEKATSGSQSEASEGLVPTTSVLTATTLTYAIRAGITAGAGTRLVL